MQIGLLHPPMIFDNKSKVVQFYRVKPLVNGLYPVSNSMSCFLVSISPSAVRHILSFPAPRTFVSSNSADGNPPIKLKLGPQVRGGLLVANHLDQSLWWDNQKHEKQFDHTYYTLFYNCTALLRLLPATATCAIMLSQNHFPEPNLHNYAEPKPFSWPKLAYVGFSASNFTVQDHILSTAEDAPT